MDLHTFRRDRSTCPDLKVITTVLKPQKADYFRLIPAILLHYSFRVTCFRLVYHKFSFRTCLEKQTKDE